MYTFLNVLEALAQELSGSLSLNDLIFKFLFCSLIYLNVEYMYVDLINLLLISSSDSNRTLNANGQRLHIRSLIVLSLH